MRQIRVLIKMRLIMHCRVWPEHVLGLAGLAIKLLGRAGPTLRPDLLVGFDIGIRYGICFSLSLHSGQSAPIGLAMYSSSSTHCRQSTNSYAVIVTGPTISAFACIITCHIT